jgi:hypothetical protein
MFLAAGPRPKRCRNKAQIWVFEALQRIRQRLPFPLLGLDSDNGSEFVNQELLRYCQQERLTFTRARPYRKNDNCYVEQKNYSVVRQTVGYQRFDTTAELMVLQQLYTTLRLYTNFFQPTMKLKSKERFGSRVKKSYHAPQTPYQRVLACAEVTLADKKKLQRQYRLLNPADHLIRCRLSYFHMNEFSCNPKTGILGSRY